MVLAACCPYPFATATLSALYCYTRPPPSKRLEQATRNFSTKELQRNKPGGLYSTIGRSKVGLIETDIDDLTATATSRTDVLAATKRAVVAKSLANHSDGILAGLLGQKPTAILPTANPACFRDPLGSRTGTPGPPKLQRSNDHTTERRSKQGGSRVRGLAAAPPPAETNAAAPRAFHEEGVERNERLRVLGADENRHRENLADNLRRLRALVGESEFKGEIRRAGSPSLFSVRELRAIGAAERQRKWPTTCGAREDGPAGDNGVQEAGINWAGAQQPTGPGEKAQQGGTAAELAVGGNVLLRNLARVLFSSMQSRIQSEFLVLGFRQWKVRNCFGVVFQHAVRHSILLERQGCGMDKFTWIVDFGCSMKRLLIGWEFRAELLRAGMLSATGATRDSSKLIMPHRRQWDNVPSRGTWMPPC